MKARIRKRIKLIPLEELREKNKKKRQLARENYHKFYARFSMTPAEWEAMQVKRRKD